MYISLIPGHEKLITNLNFLQLLQRPASITLIILNNTAKIFFLIFLVVPLRIFRPLGNIVRC